MTEKQFEALLAEVRSIRSVVDAIVFMVTTIVVFVVVGFGFFVWLEPK